eukprot:1147165-Pelagomonas_calceolata.AAC.1
MGPPACKTTLENKYQSKGIKGSFLQTLPPYIHNAFQNWTQATQEKMGSPLEYNTHYLHYWSSDPRDILVGAQLGRVEHNVLNTIPSHPDYNYRGFSSATPSVTIRP